MCVHHFLDLRLVFGLDCPEHRVLRRFELSLVERAAFLQLFQGHLKFALRLDQISFVVVFLILKELYFTLPQGLVSVIG